MLPYSYHSLHTHSGTDADDERPLSPVVKESGIVDVSRDPLKYYNIKGEIIGLTGLVVPTGLFLFGLYPSVGFIRA